MQINTELWGNSSEWNTVSHGTDFNFPNVKMSPETYSSIYGNTGTESADIDLSIAPWGIGGDSWLCNLYMATHWRLNSGDSNPYELPEGQTVGYSLQCDKNAGKPHPMILFTKFNGNSWGGFTDHTTAKMSNVYRYYPAANNTAPAWTARQTLKPQNAGGWQKCPVTEFDYKNFILRPYIIGHRQDTSQIYIYPLHVFTAAIINPATYDNIAGWRQNNINITGIGYDFAIGAAGSRDISDDTNYIFSIGTKRQLECPDIEIGYTYSYPPNSNVPAESAHITTGTLYSTVMSTALSTPISGYFPTYQDISAHPFRYWYERCLESSGQDVLNNGGQYYTGGADWKIKYTTPSGAIPGYSSSANAIHYMYWDITDVSDTDALNELWKQVALLGFCFTTNGNVQGIVGTDAFMAMPVLENGITTGDYKTGTEARSLDNFTWVNAWEDSGYNPYQPTDSEQDIGDFNTILRSGTITSGAMYYTFTAAELTNLVNWLNTAYQPTTVDQLTIDFRGSNPTDYITTIKYYPFDVPAITPGRAVNIGGVATGFNGGELPYSYGSGYTMFDLGSYYLDRYYGDWRDYETKIVMYIPYCGSVECDPKLYYGHNIGVKMSVDFVTGSCTAYIYRDSLIIDSLNGSIGIDIPISAIAQGNYQNVVASQMQALRQAENNQLLAGLSVVGGLIGTAASAASGNILGAGAGLGGIIGGAVGLINSAENIDNIQYGIDHTAPTLSTISAASPFNGALTEYNVRIWIFRPKTLSGYNADIYSKTVGHASAIPGKIGDYSGYVECTNADLTGITATDSELAMIKTALQNGVYV